MDNTQKNSMLDLISKPAFAVRNGVILQVNPSAAQKMIAPGASAADMICTGREEYSEFSGGCLYLTLEIQGLRSGASVTKVDDSDIFMLEEEAELADLNTLALAAQGLRSSLTGIMVSADRLFPMVSTDGSPESEALVAQINKNLFRMLRIVGNMSDASQFLSAAPGPQQTLDICSFMDEFFQKAEVSLAPTGIHLQYTGPDRSIYTLADPDKLERAAYNILSNAMKFSTAGDVIQASLVRRGKRLYFSMESRGTIPASSLGTLYTRYRRSPGLEDPRFGIGLGMVIIRRVAALHDGTVLVDQPEENRTRVTMTLGIRQSSTPAVRNTPLKVDYAGERDHALVELSDVLPAACYQEHKIN